MPSRLEAALSRHRTWSIVALVMLTVFAWLWLIGGAGMRTGSPGTAMPRAVTRSAIAGLAMPDPAMADPAAWGPARLALMFSMWWTMMIAMMLPSAAPTILLHARTARRASAAVAPGTASFLAGYLTAWGGFSLLAAALQAILENSGLLEAMRMSSRSRWLSAAILFAAGLYQLTPAKALCLRHCRNPAGFLIRHYRPGRRGALHMGLTHGTYCIGCCWLLMTLLFVGGVMNLVWIALLAVAVAAEKLLPHGRLVSLCAGWAGMVWGVSLLLA
ncbi:MAG: DUF2182 domain-containing protein [Sphingomonadales bacterium]|nr:DUF2182 domain-containing protein [Sphingomonadales bacterium]